MGTISAAAPTARIKPLAVAIEPSARYSVSSTASTCRRRAPSVLRSAPSRSRCTRDVARAPSRTSTPASALKAPRKATACRTRVSTESIASCTREKSSADTLGYAATRSRCTRARASTSSTRTSMTMFCGASSSGPGSSTAKKLGSRRCQSTERRLVTTEGTSMPATSHVTVSPISTRRSSAMSISSERPGRRPAPSPSCGGRPSHQRPATSSSADPSSVR